MQHEGPLAVLFAVDQDQDSDDTYNPILIVIGNKVEVEKKKEEIEAVIAEFDAARNNIIANNPYKTASELRVDTHLEYMKHIGYVRTKMQREMEDLFKDKPPYYNHTLIMLSQ